MPGAATCRMLPDGRRLHMQHGPIDLIIEGFGAPAEIAAAYRQAWERFRSVLAELVAELPLLRLPAGPDHPGAAGPVARRMLAGCAPHTGSFITPMAAVAGAVADEVLAAMLAGRALARAYVNNGGDIALHLAPGTRLDVGLVASPEDPGLSGVASVASDWPVRGVATSGWRGRSFSLGIADAVTVLARNAADADAAVTLAANAVDAEDPSIRRQRACDLDEGSDLGARLVTRAVGPLPPAAIALALARGAACAEAMRRAGSIYGAVLLLQGRMRVVGPVAPGRSRPSVRAGCRSPLCLSPQA
jgi:uncharacterized protein